jgi:hypothetical protein
VDPRRSTTQESLTEQSPGLVWGAAESNYLRGTFKPSLLVARELGSPGAGFLRPDGGDGLREFDPTISCAAWQFRYSRDASNFRRGKARDILSWPHGIM